MRGLDASILLLFYNSSYGRWFDSRTTRTSSINQSGTFLTATITEAVVTDVTVFEANLL
jgi:hypothetical protein